MLKIPLTSLLHESQCFIKLNLKTFITMTYGHGKSRKICVQLLTNLKLKNTSNFCTSVIRNICILHAMARNFDRAF